MITKIYIFPLLFIIFNLLIVFNYKYLTKKLNIIDFPIEKRKIHKYPTPLFGGIIIFFNFLLFFTILLIFDYQHLLETFLLTETKALIYFFIIANLIFCLGLYDDKYNIRAIYRILIIGFLVFCSIFVDSTLEINYLKFTFFNHVLNIDKASLLFPLLCFVVLIISCNMSDGINLQSFLFNFVNFLAIYIIKENLLALMILISLIFFCFLNIKGKIFLGDSGSYFLSFLMGFFFIKYYNYGYGINAEQTFLFLIFPVLDATRCIFTRLIRGKNILSSDNIHLHYLLLKHIGYLKTIIILGVIYIIPLISYVLNLNTLLVLIIIIFFYSILLIKYQS
jgi:UDP-GlcNAc:undecaprenyl-phosphate GlcNAc-1-phosphate transferase